MRLLRSLKAGFRGGRLGKPAVLRLGFAGMIALLLFSAAESYRIQHAASYQSAQIYRRYVQQNEIQTRLRRLLYLGSIQARDFFLSDLPDRAGTFRKQLADLEAEADAELVQLQAAAGRSQSLLELQVQVHEFWSVLESALRRPEELRGSQAYAFVQSEIVPRRNTTSAMLRQLGEISQEALRASEAEFERSRDTALWWLLGIMGLCLALGLAVARFSLRHAARLEQESLRRLEEVTQAKRDLQQLSARLLEIQEDERRRIARELHDEIGQTLTALRIEISRAQAAWKAGSPDTRDRLEEARLLAERTVDTVRNISLLLRPSLLDDLGLAPALQWQAEDFSRRSGIPCSFSEEGLEEALPDTLKTCVYRIVQEALNNCEKHAGATAVRVVVCQRDGELAVQVADNGRGFALDRYGNPAGSGGLGILGIRERLARLGGSLNLESGAGRGTRLEIRLPVPRPSAEASLAAAGEDL